MLLTDEVAWTRVVLADGEPPPRRPDQARQTLHRILGGSLAALVVLVATGYLVGARIAEFQALSDSRRLTETVGGAVVGPDLTSGVLEGRPEALGRLNHTVSNGILRHTMIRRVKIWSSAGVVLYSNDPSEIGRSFPLDDDERRVLATGRSFADVSNLSRAENASDRTLGNRMVEVYTALRGADGQPVLFEAYFSYQEVETQRASVFTLLSTLAIGLLGIFALFQVWLSVVNLRWMRRRQEELEDAAEAVSGRERRRLARDLHDGVVQELVGTAFLIDGARAATVSGDLARADMLLDRTADTVRSSVQALRATLIAVYPPTLSQEGLAQALEDLTQPLRTRGVQVTVADLVDRSLPRPAIETTYRVAQEAVRNISRHARASTVQIRVYIERARLCLLVQDDGVGIATQWQSASSLREGHFGLRNLADIALEAHAYLELRAAPDRGTEIRWEMPL